MILLWQGLLSVKSMLSLSVNGLKSYEKLVKSMPDAANQAAVLAINFGVDKARIEGSKIVRGKVRLSKAYVDSGFKVFRARPGNLIAVLSARQRPTSFARYSAGSARKRGVRVTITPGRSRVIDRAFKIRLRRGNRAVRDGFNTGVALRLKKGEMVQAKKIPFSAGDSGLVLLYGPSVDQVFSSSREAVIGRVEPLMNREFIRQFNRLI